MRDIKIKSSKVRLAQFRYYDLERHASEIPDEKFYAVLVEINGTYINALNLFEELPVYDRSSYANVSKDGLTEFGNKIVLVNGEEQEGKCLILEKGNLSYDLKKEEVTIKDIEKYVLDSELFFPDRLRLLDTNRKQISSIYRKRLLVDDTQKLNRFNEYFDSFEKGMELEKK